MNVFLSAPEHPYHMENPPHPSAGTKFSLSQTMINIPSGVVPGTAAWFYSAERKIPLAKNPPEPKVVLIPHRLRPVQVSQAARLLRVAP